MDKKQGLLVAAFVVIGAAVLGGISWYINTNINPPAGGQAAGTQAVQSSGQAASSSVSSATSTNNPSTSSMDGLKIVDTTVGTGTVAENGDIVTVNYVGKLDNGSTFDSSYSRNQPFSFTLGAGNVIKGWDLGVLGMKVGGTRELTIPPDLGYGAGGFPPVIPPNATLHFTITLLSVTNPAAK